MSKSLKNNASSYVASVATVWLLDGRTVSEDQLLHYVCWLNPEELQRYQRFLRVERQRQFLLGRILLRFALGKLLDVLPTSISLSERAGHAPVLNLDDTLPGFSLAHSGPWVACAVCEHSALGIDIEMLDETRDLVALAEQAFDANECALLMTKDATARVATFYTLWSTKEARHKLASTSTSDTAPHCIVFPHTDISIVLCSERPLMDAALRIFDNWEKT